MKELLRCLVLLACLLFTLAAQAQTFEWARKIGSWDDDHGHNISLDAQQHLYFSGGMYPGFIDSIPVSPYGCVDGVVAKFDAEGQAIWANSFGNAFCVPADQHCLDEAGNMYVLTLVFEDFFIDTLVLHSPTVTQICIAKYSPQGELRWAKMIQGSTWHLPPDMLYSHGRIHLMGQFGDSMSIDGHTLYAQEDWNNFLMQMDTAGQTQWLLPFHSPNLLYLGRMGIDTAGNTYVSGTFRGNSITIDSVLIQDTAQFAHIIAKVNANGHLVWVQKAHYGMFSSEINIAIPPSGDIYLTGRGSFTTDTWSVLGDTLLWIARCDSALNLKWVRTLNAGLGSRIEKMAIDSQENAYMIGTFSEWIELGGTRYEYPFNLSLDGVFVAGHAADGTLLHHFAPSMHTFGDKRAIDILVHGDSALYLFGRYQYAMAMGNDSLPGTVSFDLFLAKYLLPPPVSTLPGISQPLPKIYPNPASSAFTISHPAIRQGDEVRLYQIDGRLAAQYHLSAPPFQIEVGDLPRGIYICEILLKTGAARTKLVVE